MLVNFANLLRKPVTFTVVALMMLASLVTPMPIAAQAQTIQSELTGVSISYSAPYVIDPSGANADDVMETIMFTGAADVLAIGFMTPLIDLNGARDILLEALFGEAGTAATIDRGDYSGVSYSLDMLNLDGMEMGVFSLFMNQRSHGFSEFYIFIAPPALFGATMQTAQNSFTINGSQLMDGVDATVMGNMVTANIGITGGTAVTDVTEVTETTQQAPATTTPVPNTTGTETGEGEILGYMLELTFAVGPVDEALVEILSLFQQQDEGVDLTIVRAGLDEQFLFLSQTNDRIAQIQPPAGKESLHQDFLAWGDAVTAAGTAWFDFTEGRSDSTTASTALTNAIDVHIAFTDQLASENVVIAAPPPDTSTQTETSETPVSTEVAQTSATSSDGTAYIATVQEHRSRFLASFVIFTTHLSAVSDETSTQADIDAARTGSLAEAETWVGYSANAQQLTPPAGYEDVHQAYLNWAAAVSEAGNLWLGAMNMGDRDMLDAFFNQIELVLDADDELGAMLENAEQNDSGAVASGTTGTESNTSETTGSTSRSTRTSTTESGTGESTTSSGRTSRTTSSPDATSGSSERTSRTSRSGSESTEQPETGNTSETSGTNSRANRTNVPASNGGGEWYMEINGVTVTWNDAFELSGTAAEAQTTNTENSQESIALQTETPDGISVRFLMSVFPNASGNASGLANVLTSDPAELAVFFGDDAEIIESVIDPRASALLIRTSDDVGEYWVYVQTTCVNVDCSSYSLLIIESTGYPLVDTLDVMNDGLLIDGTSVSDAIPVDDVEDAVDRLGN